MEEKKIRILHIEDDPDDALIMRKLIEKSAEERNAYQITRASTLEKGLLYLRSETFDLALLDLSLPDSRGLETFLKLREIIPHVPVVICSGLDDEKVAIEAIGKGAQDYVIKGQIPQPMFERILRYALERRKVQEMREEFVGMIVHDLRTPLVVSLESLSQILEGYYGEVPEGQQELLTMARRGMIRLNHLIDDLLEMTKVELGKIKLAPSDWDLVQLAKEEIRGFEPLARKKGLELLIEAPGQPVKIRADRDKILQVFVNLISNAIKFTPQGFVKITVENLPGKPEVLCSVSDSGPGIAEENLKRLFQAFERLQEKDAPKIEGTGLGLAISKRILVAHGGRVWAESRAGLGTKIIFTLPKTPG